MKFFIFIFIFILSIPLLSKERDAVMLKIVSDLKVSKTTYNIFRSGAEMSLTKSDYALLDEKTQEEALNSQNGKNECLDDSCLIDTGKMLAAKILFIVSIKKAGKFYLFNAKLINLETSTTEKSFSVIYEHSLNDVKKLFDFSKKLTVSTLNIKPVKKKKKQRSILFSKNISYLTPYFKIGLLLFDLDEEDFVKFLYSGLGISLVEYKSEAILINLNIDLSYNFADRYFVTNLSSRAFYEISKNLNLGAEVGVYMANSKLRPRGGLASEYKIDIYRKLFLKFNFNFGVMKYNIPIRENKSSSFAIYTDLSTSIVWDF